MQVYNILFQGQIGYDEVEHLEEVNAPTLLPFINAGDNNDKLGLKIQAWTSGAIDCDSLVARIYECFQQVLCLILFA